MHVVQELPEPVRKKENSCPLHCKTESSQQVSPKLMTRRHGSNNENIHSGK